MLGLPYVRLNREDFTILGAAIIGGKAVGLFEDMQDTARSFLRVKDTIQPRDELHKGYKKYVEVYDQVYRDLRQLYSRLSDIRSVAP